VSEALAAQPLLLDLGPAVKSAGFAVIDHAAVISELSALSVEGVSERAVPKRRAEFLAGRFAAKVALAALGVDAMPSRKEDGSPVWPVGITGSITHGAERALCAVARASDVLSLGIDAERLMNASASAELRSRICLAEERALLSRELDRPEHELVTLAFSAKESLYKCLFPLIGKFMDFRAARVVAVVSQAESAWLRGELTLELSVDWSVDLRRGQRFRASFVASERHVETAVVMPA
jgi:enterobactin synthetase component D